MAQRKRREQDGPDLFEAQERHVVRRVRRQRALFIPRLLREAASNTQLKDAAQDRAYEIAVRWADLETSGYLAEQKETSIDTQFLDQLFGEGLGYQVKTANPDAWQLEHKFTVPGIGTADAALELHRPAGAKSSRGTTSYHGFRSSACGGLAAPAAKTLGPFGAYH